MKKVLSYFLAVVLIAGLFACKGSKADMVAAKWKVSDISDGKEIPAEQKEMVDKMMAEMKKTAYFDIKKDGSMEVSMMGKVSKMTWKLNEDGTKLVTKEEGKDKEESLNITEVTANKLVLTDPNGSNTKITLEK
ncbi:MAG: lipocalin family protein [Bacteroidota bacterium]